jgi:hypothetical protein
MAGSSLGLNVFVIADTDEMLKCFSGNTTKKPDHLLLQLFGNVSGRKLKPETFCKASYIINSLKSVSVSLAGLAAKMSGSLADNILGSSFGKAKNEHHSALNAAGELVRHQSVHSVH